MGIIQKEITIASILSVLSAPATLSNTARRNFESDQKWKESSQEPHSISFKEMLEKVMETTNDGQWRPGEPAEPLA